MKNRVFCDISRLRRDIVFLLADSESTHNFTSYRVFHTTFKFFLLVCGSESCSEAKTGNCCSELIQKVSDRTEGTIEKFMFESTYNRELGCFF